MWSNLIHFLRERIEFSADEVYPNLWMSSKISNKKNIEQVRALGITTVIDLEGGFDPPMDFLKTYLYWPIKDVPMLPNLELLFMVSNYGSMEIRRGGRVLIHCSQGLNRSGLVAGRLLTLFFISGQKAINMIREKRIGSLNNPVFVEYLRGLY